MLDVGAHEGESFAPFAERGWRIDCFEPNPAKHSAIRAQIIKSRGNVALYPVAVSNVSEEGLTFYLSEQSTGISSLHAFHETHRASFRVNAISLRDHLAARGNPKVDFLKIDVEGYDFFVLQGIDWNCVVPEIIVCEFEDRKTVGLGYDYRDMAEYLVDRGYEVIISEWRPIEEYGRAHTWSRYTRFPSALECPDSWGNLIAMQPGPAAEAVKTQLKKIGKIVD